MKFRVYKRYCAAAIMAASVVLFLGAGNELRIRRPVAAGIYYPADPAQLRAAIQQYISEAEPIPVPDKLAGCVVPHSPYNTAGATMADAFAYLKPGQYKRVIILAPSLFADFRGLSIPSLQYYRTPLGDTRLDAPAIRRICVNSLIGIRGLTYRQEAYNSPNISRTALHERETIIETVLPFLQVQLGRFDLVPIVCGTLEKANGGLDERALGTIVNTLNSIVDEDTLVVACSEFTRYGVSHDFTPFTRDILDNISQLDMQAIQLVEERRVRGLRAYLDKTKNPISAPLALSILMRLMPTASRGILAGYEQTGRLNNNPRNSVSFAAIVFMQGGAREGTVHNPVRITDGLHNAEETPPMDSPSSPAPESTAPAEQTPAEGSQANVPPSGSE